MKKIFSILFLMIALIIPQLACNAKVPNNNQGVSKTSFHLDTVCTITIYSMDDTQNKSEEELEKEAFHLMTDAFKLCDEYEKILSKTVVGSDIYNINNADGKWVDVNQITAETIKKGIEYGNVSNGAFDITIGDVTDLWDFHKEDEDGEKTGELPDKNLLSEAAKHVDYNNIEIEGNKVRLKDSNANIDLGGIAKGYIADKVAEYLELNGVTSAVVDLGGNIVVIGQKGSSIKDGEGVNFSIGVASPVSDRGGLLGTILCSNKTIVTSGTYERYFEIDGVRYHHVLNPDTGYPVETDLLAVTIVGERGASADCDGLSTTCLALGKEKAVSLIEKTKDVGAILVDSDGEVTAINVENFEQKM